MSRRRELTIITVIIISIIVMTLGSFEIRQHLILEELDQRNKLVQVEKEAYESKNSLQSQVDKSRQLNNNLDITQKINQGLDLKVLYIGNDDKDRYGNYIGRPKALDSLVLDLENHYSGSVDYRYLSTNGASIIMGWELYRKLKDPLYDILVLDGYLSPDLDEQSQGLFMEDLIRNYLTDNPQGSIIWLGDDLSIETTESQDQATDNQDQVTDSRSLLTGNQGLLIDKYHILVLGKNSQNLKKMITLNKGDYKSSKAIYSDQLEYLDYYQSTVYPSSEAGFRVTDGLLASDKRQSYLVYDERAAYYIFQYAVHPDGGTIHLLLDDQEVETIETVSDVIHTKTLLVNTKDAKQVALVAESGFGESVVLVSVSICDKNRP